MAIFTASLNICFQFFIKSKCKLKQEQQVALTFDDGPHPQNTARVLDVLKEMDVKASFFVIGEKAKQYPELIKRIVNEGHTLGHHSYYHSSRFALKSTAGVKEEIEQTMSLLENISGYKSRYFRPPFGVTNPNIAKAIRLLNLQSIAWSLRSYDTTYTPEMVVNKLTKKLKSKDIVLMHDHLATTADIIRTIVDKGRRNGLIFVNLEHY